MDRKIKKEATIMSLYVDVIQDTPVQGRKWRVVLKWASSGGIVMKGMVLYRYKRDAQPMKKELEKNLKRGVL